MKKTVHKMLITLINAIIKYQNAHHVVQCNLLILQMKKLRSREIK